MSEELTTEFKKEIVDMESLFKDGKGLDDLDFDKIELVRGKTPHGIEEKCLNLCKDYLSGDWCRQTLNTIQVKRITGGVVNQIYYCGIRQTNKSEDVPQEVAIKFYGEFKPFDDENDKSRIKDQVISLVFSERNLGPKIYGIFEGGQIQKFYKQRSFSGEEQKDPKIIRKVFGAFARIHSLDFPIKKNGKHLLEKLNEIPEEGIEKLNKMIEEFNCETFKKYDFMTEINWIKGVAERVNSPVVFCHKDFRSSNLMITEPNDEIVVCDFDLSGYNYRGTDFSFMMMEWGKKHLIQDMKNIDNLPLGSELIPFIEVYVEECQRIHGKSYIENEINSVNHILKEAKVFLLLSYIHFIAMNLQHRADDNKDKRPTPSPKFIAEFSESGYQNYITIKRLLSEQKLFD